MGVRRTWRLSRNCIPGATHFGPTVSSDATSCRESSQSTIAAKMVSVQALAVVMVRLEGMRSYMFSRRGRGNFHGLFFAGQLDA